MTRRHPPLKPKQLKRDSKIVWKIIQAWDHKRDWKKALEIFIENKDKLSDYRYWEILRSIWIIAGRLETIPTFLPLFKSKKKHKYYFNTPEELVRLRSMPEVFTVFRACDDPEDCGLSWTLSEKYARKYQKMYSKDLVIEKQVHKSDVFAFIERNLEEEILII